MDEVLLQRIRERTPTFNETLAEGLACEHMKHATAYIDRLFECNKERFPEGFLYEGSQPCDPKTQHKLLTKEYGGKRRANIAKHDVFAVRYNFSYKGEPLEPRYVLLPFVRPGGIIHLNGGTYNISPVLTDVAYSVGRDILFIAFRATKLIFQRTDYHFFANGQRDVMAVIYSRIHKAITTSARDRDKRRRIETCLPHYFFSKFGVTQTFQQYAGAPVRVGWMSEFPEEQYPRDQYTVFHSAHLFGKHPNDRFCLMVPVEHDTSFVRMLVSGFFYVMDTFPDHFTDPRQVDDVDHWKTFLGRIISGDYESRGRLLEDIDTHMLSLDTYLDEITKDEFRERGIELQDFYSVLYHVMTSLVGHFYQTGSEEASMYGKRFMVLRYVLKGFNEAISRFSFEFHSHRRRKSEWTVNEINDLLRKWFKLNQCVGKLTSLHGEVNAVSYPGDNKILRITSMLIPQDKADRSKSHSGGQISDTSKLLHASIAEVGQYSNLPKTGPDGRDRANMHVKLSLDGLVERNEQFRELLDETQRRFHHRDVPSR